MALKKRVFSIFLLVIFIVLVCPIYLVPVSALTVGEFDIPCCKPQISDNNGYIEVLFRNDTTREYSARVYSWFTNPIGNDVGDTWVDVSASSSEIVISPGFHIYDASSSNTRGARMSWFMVSNTGAVLTGAKNQYYGESTTPNSQSLSINGFSVVGFRCYGNARLVIDNISSKSNFIINYSETSTAIDTLFDLIKVVNRIESDVDTIDQNTYSIATNLIQLVNNTDTVEDKLQACIDYLTSINLGIQDVNDELDRIENSVDDIETKLDRIIELLESNFDVETPSNPNTDNITEHNRLEDELIGGDYEQQKEDIEVSVDSNASGFIWDTITKFINTNPYIMGLFISILSVSILALLLNR